MCWKIFLENTHPLGQFAIYVITGVRHQESGVRKRLLLKYLITLKYQKMNILNIEKDKARLQPGQYVNPKISLILLFVKCLSILLYKKDEKCKPMVTLNPNGFERFIDIKHLSAVLFFLLLHRQSKILNKKGQVCFPQVVVIMTHLFETKIARAIF